jgi:aldehyde dehydrogenase (NAD+)
MFMTSDQFSDIIEKQNSFFNSHQTLDPEFRKLQLIKLKQVIKTSEKEIEKALLDDLGKCEFEAFSSEIGWVIHELTIHIKNLKKWGKPKKTETRLIVFPSAGYIYKQPLGKILIIGPFNYPFMLVFMPLIGAISAGNVVLVKPSEIATHTTAIIAKIISTAFNPAHVSVVQGGLETNQKLLSKRWDKIFFTGSTKVGKIVMQAAALHLTPVVLELGGKNPAVVDRDANLKIAARRIIWGKLLNAGQTCVAPDYLFVHREVKEELLDLMKDAIKQFFTENIELNPDYPKIINETAVSRLKGLIGESTVYCGGYASNEKKHFAPTILTDVTVESEIMKEEIFGPVLPVLTFENTDEALNFIQNREKPLSIYYFSEDRDKQRDFLNKSYSGNAGINDVVLQFVIMNLPFGGVGYSGMGAYHGKRSFDLFSHERSVIKTTTKFDFPLRYPPYKNSILQLIRFLLR